MKHDLKNIRDVSDLPGQAPIKWRGMPGLWALIATLAAIAWPPLILTLPLMPPSQIMPGFDMDWRLQVLIAGVIAVPLGMYMLARERDRSGSPSTRLGVIWRFLLYGGLLAALLQVLTALVMTGMRWVEAGALAQSLGAAETTLLIFGVAGLPLAMLIGLSYALWAGLCVALIAFTPRPPPVRPRAGLLDSEGV
ncbi:phthalate transporter [Brevundimonas sp.]|uniref:phthalate transporter n=1 Tax=Brevundimonas sp. TaxID=1871086 RepID=UPI001D5655F9|nr:phthalate transporter [Brevundimonas sp.]MBA4000182.1 phthalate transporter [Brevundimonas sp.]